MAGIRTHGLSPETSAELVTLRADLHTAKNNHKIKLQKTIEYKKKLYHTKQFLGSNEGNEPKKTHFFQQFWMEDVRSTLNGK